MADNLKVFEDRATKVLNQRKSQNEKYAKHIESLKSYATNITENYVQTLNMIVDVSSIFTQYQQMLDKVLGEIEKDTETFENIVNMQSTGSEKLASALAQIDTQLQALQKLSDLSPRKDEFKSNLAKIQSMIADAKTKITFK